MSKVLTNGGVPILNCTRYETEDLVAICNLIEERVAAATGNLWPADTRFPTGEQCINFLDYTTKNHTIKHRTWNAKANSWIFSEVRNYTSGMGTWNTTAGEVRLVPPGKLYIDPIEALAADASAAPKAFRQAVYDELISIYPQARNCKSAMNQPLPDGLQLRINSRKATKRPKREMNEVARAHLKRKAWNSKYYAGRAIDALHDCMKEMRIGNGHAKKCSHPAIDYSEVENMLVDLSAFRDKLSRIVSALE